MPARHHTTVEFSTPTPKDVYNKQVYLTALVASMGAFMFGYDLAFIGTTITLGPFEKDFGLADAPQEETDAFSANIVSLLQAGCFFGSLAAAPLGDRLGRKAALMIAGVSFCIGSLMQTVSYGIVGLMFAGRAIGGLVSESVRFQILSVLTVLAGCRSGKWLGAFVRGRVGTACNQRPFGRHL